MSYQLGNIGILLSNVFSTSSCVLMLASPRLQGQKGSKIKHFQTTIIVYFGLQLERSKTDIRSSQLLRKSARVTTKIYKYRYTADSQKLFNRLILKLGNPQHTVLPT